MIKPSAYKAPHYIVEKLSRLRSLVKAETEKYKLAAYGITDYQFRNNVTLLAQESDQYFFELTSQLRVLGEESIDQEIDSCNDAHFSAEEAVLENASLQQNITLQVCKDSEKRLIQAYREILNEPFLMDGLRILIRRQLNGIMYTFLQLKLLTSCS